MNKIIYRLLSAALVVSLAAGIPFRAHAAASVYYVSPAGSDANAGTLSAPFKTIQKAASRAVAGDTIILLAGKYSGVNTVTLKGTTAAPLILLGNGAVFDGGSLVLKNSEWLIVQGLTFRNAVDQITVLSSHYVIFRNNVFDFSHAGILVKEYSSHLLIENNEFFQTCAQGKTWSQLKGSACEGGAVYASSYGGGSYHIRNNWVHDAFNGFLFTDDTAGQWMNSNIFIFGNRFERVADDPVEPEGDSFNFHVYNNTMTDTHRLVSLTTKGVGPIFIYNNVQITRGNPTGEASRLNSAFKVDLSKGYANGVWIFNNTIVGNAAANFYAYDMLSRKVATPWTVRNNVYLTALKAFSKTPSGGSFDYDISKAAFGVTEPNGKVADPLLAADGSLLSNSPAIGKSSAISIPKWFSSSSVVNAGSNLGAFQTIPTPVWVAPPDYPASKIPANVAGWPDAFSNLGATRMRALSEPQVQATLAVTETPPPAAAPLATETPVQPALIETVAAETETAASTAAPTETALSPAPLDPVASTPEPPTPQPASEVVYDDAAFSYSGVWYDVAEPQAYQGAYKQAVGKDSVALFSFNGTSFTLSYTLDPSFGGVEIYVDDVLAGTVNQNGDPAFQQKWDLPAPLAQGSHTLKLVFAENGVGSVDAVTVR
ncbi:MAG: DUF1565 domain-containing protein [Chloroflexi bacterium]|nr:DUF1565 domain-containing protein [Chloroflexota bacterium]MCA2001858.1 DUF1565 domain-containing protein [Chloroflexota bacterium]